MKSIIFSIFFSIGLLAQGNGGYPPNGVPGTGQGTNPGSGIGTPGSGQGQPGSGIGQPGSGQGYPGGGYGRPGTGQGIPDRGKPHHSR